MHKRPNENAPHEWTTLTSELLTNAPNPVAVLREIEARLRRKDYSGSLATELQERLQLLERLNVESADLVAAKEEVRGRLHKRIEAARQRELEENRSNGGSFE